MKTENVACPPDPMLADFGLGKLDAASSDTVSQHLETCADCRQRVAGLSGDSFIARLRNVPGHAPDSEQAPQRIDRTFVAGELASDSSSGAESQRDESRHGPAAPPELTNHQTGDNGGEGANPEY